MKDLTVFTESSISSKKSSSMSVRLGLSGIDGTQHVVTKEYLIIIFVVHLKVPPRRLELMDLVKINIIVRINIIVVTVPMDSF